MAKLTQKSAETLETQLINTVLENINIALQFYRKRPTQQMRNSLEETVIENLTFARLVAESSERGKDLLKMLEKLSNDIVTGKALLPVEDF